MENKRALRRHHKERLKEKRRDYYGQRWKRSGPSYPGTEEKYLMIAIDTPTPCSCWGCGNPRKYLGEKTIQEKRFNERMREELNALYCTREASTD